MNLISNDQLETKLQASPAPRVTKEQMEARIVDVIWTRIGETLTRAAIKLDNGCLVTGESACVNPANYNEEIGKKIAYDNAFQKLWYLFGFQLAESNLKQAA